MKEFYIANQKIKNRYVLAPIAGYSDYPFRELAREYGAGLLYTEMQSCEAIVYNSKETLKDLEDTHLDKKNALDSKLALQIFSGNKEMVLKAIPLFEKYATYDFLDFNCGCPVPKVIKQHAGSFWLNRQDELIDLLKAMVKISSKPVIIKIRIGFSNIIDVVSLAKRIEDAGVKAIAIHGRTRNEGFSGEVHYDIIKEVKHNVGIPIIANGNIDQNNYEDVFLKTDADALMIATKAMGYPKIFDDMIKKEEGKEVTPTTLSSQIKDLRRHLDLIYQTKDNKKASDIMRSFSIKYFKGFDNISKYRTRLVHCTSKEMYLDILDEMEKELKG